METPEVHQPDVRHRRSRRGREGLPQWLELAVAVSALITSISSIVLAIGNGRSMDKLVKANSIPYLESGFSTATPEGAEVLSLDLVNRGVGPAHEQSLRVTVDGRPVKSFAELAVASLGPDQGRKTYQGFHQTHTLVRNNVPKRFIPGGQSQLVFKVPRTAQNARWWDLLVKQQPRWNVAFCYCSVFDECWLTRSEFADSRPVKQCTRDEAVEFIP
jgi:hypothetical protein